MGVHELVTGLNGAGKTLYTLAEKVRPLIGTKVGTGANAVSVRLVVGGVRDLLLPHELMDMPELDAETFKDEWRTVKRDPGRPAVRWVRRGARDEGWEACEADDTGAEPLPWSILNWWAWCEPGDVILPDECQRVFRPMASGKRVPMFVSKLETARHYGVRFIYVTQHPQLLHMNVRQLVGPIEDVSRVFGGSRTLVRQWDRIGDYGKKASATTRMWRHDKSAFGLYKSAELHTKFGGKLPLAVYAMVGGLIALAAIAWVLKNRLAERFNPTATATTAAGKGTGAGTQTASPQTPPQAVVAPWPRYVAEPMKAWREPLDGQGVQYEGGYTPVSGAPVAMFGLMVDGQRVATLTLKQITRMGYTWTEFGPCVGVLRVRDVERPVACGKATPASERSQSPPPQSQSVPASSPVA